MDEASLCERIALIQEGQILQIETPQNIVNNYRKPLYAFRSDQKYQRILDVRSHPKVDRVEAFGEYLHVSTKAGFKKEEILQFLLKKTLCI